MRGSTLGSRLAFPLFLFFFAYFLVGFCPAFRRPALALRSVRPRELDRHNLSFAQDFRLETYVLAMVALFTSNENGLSTDPMACFLGIYFIVFFASIFAMHLYSPGFP